LEIITFAPVNLLKTTLLPLLGFPISNIFFMI